MEKIPYAMEDDMSLICSECGQMLTNTEETFEDKMRAFFFWTFAAFYLIVVPMGIVYLLFN